MSFICHSLLLHGSIGGHDSLVKVLISLLSASCIPWCIGPHMEPRKSLRLISCITISKNVRSLLIPIQEHDFDFWSKAKAVRSLSLKALARKLLSSRFGRSDLCSEILNFPFHKSCRLIAYYPRRTSYGHFGKTKKRLNLKAKFKCLKAILWDHKYLKF